jgi:hypothetical protein
MSNSIHINNDVNDYIENAKGSIKSLQDLIMLLEKRVVLNSEVANYSKNEIEINEALISNIKTKSELIGLRSLVLEKINYFERYSAKFKKDYDEYERTINDIMTLANSKRGSRSDINEFMLPLDNKDISELNPQAKIYILKKLKALLDV